MVHLSSLTHSHQGLSARTTPTYSEIVWINHTPIPIGHVQQVAKFYNANESITSAVLKLTISADLWILLILSKNSCTTITGASRQILALKTWSSVTCKTLRKPSSKPPTRFTLSRRTRIQLWICIITFLCNRRVRNSGDLRGVLEWTLHATPNTSGW